MDRGKAKADDCFPVNSYATTSHVRVKAGQACRSNRGGYILVLTPVSSAKRSGRPRSCLP